MRDTIVFNEKEIAQIRRMSGLGLSLDRIAILMDVSAATMDRIVARDARVKEAIEKGREETGALLRDWAFESARKGNVAMQIFLLKTREGFRETNRLELTGADGAPLQPAKTISVEESIAALNKYARLQRRLSKKA